MTEPSVRGDAWIRRFQPPAAPSGAADGATPSKPADGATPSTPADASAGTPRLVCFPHAGGSASFYHPVSAALRGRFDVLAVQYPGRQDRRDEELIDSIPLLADGVFAALRPWLADGPTAFFGHSMGAVVAYEVARRMERDAGVSPAALIVSGRRAPSRRRHTEPIHRRDDEGILAELRRLSGTDASLLADDDVVRMIMPAVRGDYRAIETYHYEPGPPLACPVTAFIGDDDPQVTTEEARAWAEHTVGGFGLRTFPGGHFYLAARREETIARIVEVLTPR